MKLKWTQRSRRDLLEIGRYIAEDNPSAARAFLVRLQDRARRAAKTPLAGRRVPETDRDDVREVLFGNYRIVYRIEKREIHVLTIFEGHRLLQKETTEE